jgi:predicted site-specific integrase-resolvase
MTMKRKEKVVERDELLTLEQAGERCGLSGWTLRRYASQGRIPSVKISNRMFIAASVIDALIKKATREMDAPEDKRLV